MTEEQTRFVPRSTRPWIEATPEESLIKIDRQIKQAEEYLAREPGMETAVNILTELRARRVHFLEKITEKERS